MIAIMPEHIEAVLLNDGWHKVVEGSFQITNSCIFGKAKGQRTPEWRGWAAFWKEASTGGTEVIYTVTVPFESILGIRSKS